MTSDDVWVAGVDGCRGGWMVVTHPLGSPELARAEILSTFAQILALPKQPRIIAIDIPIGLPERSGAGGRACDAAARALLGARQSSVFSVPCRAAVFEADYADACSVAQRLSDPPRKVSKQAFNLFPKIREADALMTPQLQRRVVECHPELAFWRLNGRQPLVLPKKIKSQPFAEGLALRRHLLGAAGYAPSLLDAARFRRAEAGDDDVIDAVAAASCAAAIVRRVAHRVLDDPPSDARGLRMEIWG